MMTTPPDQAPKAARVEGRAPVPLRPNEKAAIAASKAAAARGEFATDEQVRAIWAKHGL
jgi:predicted transcriptional regulator